MKVLGITGGVGMGKSATGKLLEERGLPVVDTDILAREVVEPGQPALEEIRRSFGSSMVDEQGNSEDGFLRLHDIYNLHLPAELVVLSACDTATGKSVKGEGLVSLVRGFMYAGASRVVASLWKVDDEATKELMVNFYRGMIEESLSAAAALRQAQLKMWNEKYWRSPFFWGAFVLQGEWR